MSRQAAGRLALSSMWAQRFEPADDLDAFFEAGRRMGFERFELSHGHSPEQIASIDPRRVSIPSVHHPCPLEAGSQPGESPISREGRTRARAQQAWIHSLETAARLGAEVVVAHLGRIEDDEHGSCRRLRFEVEARWRGGLVDGRRFDRARRSLRAWLAEREDRALERALDALPPILDRARALGLRLGLESGYHADELPTAAGMRRLLAGLTDRGYDQDVVGAWLDVGHVGARQRIGPDGLPDWLAAVEGRWLGVHLHDLVGLRDHLVPGMGELDLADLALRLPDSILVTCELDWYFDEAEIQGGIAHLDRAGWA